MNFFPGGSLHRSRTSLIPCKLSKYRAGMPPQAVDLSPPWPLVRKQVRGRNTYVSKAMLSTNIDQKWLLRTTQSPNHPPRPLFRFRVLVEAHHVALQALQRRAQPHRAPDFSRGPGPMRFPPSVGARIPNNRRWPFFGRPLNWWASFQLFWKTINK